jgi:hypothetical protein
MIYRLISNLLIQKYYRLFMLSANTSIFIRFFDMKILAFLELVLKYCKLLCVDFLDTFIHSSSHSPEFVFQPDVDALRSLIFITMSEFGTAMVTCFDGMMT